MTKTSLRMRIARRLFKADYPNDKSWDRRRETDVAVVRYCVMADEVIDMLAGKDTI